MSRLPQNMTSDGAAWRPTATRAALVERARVYGVIRSFFAARDVLEVETPTLSRAFNPDPSTESFSLPAADGRPRYLHTSPEFAMKRLLAAGYGAIWQLCRVYRYGEAGRRHNPEFTMLEWYRPGLDEHELMQEIADLMRLLVPDLTTTRVSFREAFRRWAGFDPETLALADLQRRTEQRLGWQDDDADTMLDLWLAAVIEPALPPEKLVFITDWPVQRASLAAVTPGNPPTARRFEAYWAGMELANGYFELQDPQELARRWQEGLDQRRAQAQPLGPLDDHLLAAQQQGLPSASGVALGVDRLLMGLLQVESIAEVIAFPDDRA